MKTKYLQGIKLIADINMIIIVLDLEWSVVNNINSKKI